MNALQTFFIPAARFSTVNSLRALERAKNKAKQCRCSIIVLLNGKYYCAVSKTGRVER